MAEIILTKSESGKLEGLTTSDQKRWAKFLSAVRSMMPGATLKASFKLPRSPGFHRFHFLVLGALFDAQDQFLDFEKFREWVQVGAGFCDVYPGPKGKPVAISRSIAWENLEEADFRIHHDAVMEFVRSPHFCAFLWGHLDQRQQTQMVEATLSQFEQ